MIKKAALLLAIILLTLWFLRVPLAERLATSAIGEEVTFETISPNLFGATLTNVTLKTKQATLKANGLTLRIKPFTLFSDRLIVSEISIDEPKIFVSMIPKRLDEALPAFLKSQTKAEKPSSARAVTVQKLDVTNLSIHSELPKINIKIPSLTLHDIDSDKIPLKEQLIGELIKNSG